MGQFVQIKCGADPFISASGVLMKKGHIPDPPGVQENKGRFRGHLLDCWRKILVWATFSWEHCRNLNAGRIIDSDTDRALLILADTEHPTVTLMAKAWLWSLQPKIRFRVGHTRALTHTVLFYPRRECTATRHCTNSAFEGLAKR